MRESALCRALRVNFQFSDFVGLWWWRRWWVCTGPGGNAIARPGAGPNACTRAYAEPGANSVACTRAYAEPNAGSVANAAAEQW